MIRLINRFLRDESGATMVEYAVLVALISIAAIATIVLVGTQVNEAFEQVRACMATPASCTAPAPSP